MIVGSVAFADSVLCSCIVNPAFTQGFIVEK